MADPSAGSPSDRAMGMGLQSSPEWRALMHYRPTLWGGSESTVDDPAFFISPDGKTSPGAELRAFAEALMGDTAEGDERMACRFPARAQWLRHELGMQETASPECAGLQAYLRKVRPVRAALVFPESNINSPASMFGHTLIRLDSGAESRLLSYSVNYAAELPEDPGALYALSGIVGGYKGSFSLMPYYEKLKEYSHMESRDIHEYPLSLTPDEVRRMALHIWEMRGIRSDYYFLDENCSFALLSLIEAARPGAVLTGRFSLWVLPTDTIRALREEGLIEGDEYRPSKATRIAYMETLAGGSGEVLGEALKVGTGRAEPEEVLGSTSLSEQDKALALDLAAEYTLHEYMRGGLGQEEYSARYLGTLSARSTLMKRQYHIPEAAAPEAGHGTARVSIGGGRHGEGGYALMGLRLAYHGLMDPGAGYTRGAAIEALRVEVRHYSDEDRTVLQSFMLADITSLWPRGNLIRPLSWHIRAGAERELSPGGERTPALIEGGKGLSAAMGRSALAWFLIEPSLKAGGGLRENYALGGGLTAGALYEPGGAYSLMLSGRALYYPAGDSHSQRSISLRQGLRVSRNSALMLEYTRGGLDGLYISDTSLSLNLYF